MNVAHDPGFHRSSIGRMEMRRVSGTRGWVVRPLVLTAASGLGRRRSNLSRSRPIRFQLSGIQALVLYKRVGQLEQRRLEAIEHISRSLVLLLKDFRDVIAQSEVLPKLGRGRQVD